MSPVTTSTDRLLTTEQDAAQARAVLAELHGPEGSLVVHHSGRTTVVPPELGRMIQQLLDAVARGDTLTVGRLPQELTTSTAASLLDISRPTLMKLIHSGEIPSHKVGSHHRLLTADVLAAKRARRARELAAFDALRELDDELGLDD